MIILLPSSSVSLAFEKSAQSANHLISIQTPKTPPLSNVREKLRDKIYTTTPLAIMVKHVESADEFLALKKASKPVRVSL